MQLYVNIMFERHRTCKPGDKHTQTLSRIHAHAHSNARSSTENACMQLKSRATASETTPELAYAKRKNGLGVGV